MKYSSILIIVFGMLCGCVRHKKADSSGTESIEAPQSKTDTSVGVEAVEDSLLGAKNAIYYWKTVFRLTEYDRQFLQKHHIRKIYLRMFDVDRVENADGAGFDGDAALPLQLHVGRNRNRTHGLYHHKSNQT